MDSLTRYHIQRKRRLRRGSGGPYSTLSLLKKELREGHLQSLLAGSCVVSSSNTTPDPLLSSFMYNMPLADASKNVHPHSLDGGSSVSQSSNKKGIERYEALPLPPMWLSFFLRVFLEYNYVVHNSHETYIA